MTQHAFRFLHAADFHLERPLLGISEVPDHLESRLATAVFDSAEGVFDAAIEQRVEFVTLAGGLLNANRSGPFAFGWLTNQFERLEQAEIEVYWVGGKTDATDDWPRSIPLPDNVHRFSAGQVERIEHQRNGHPLAEIFASGQPPRRKLLGRKYIPQDPEILSVAMASGPASADDLAARPLHYWALGGNSLRKTLFASPTVAHYSGSPIGRSPNQSGAHGCTLVQVDQNNRCHLTFLETDTVRWRKQKIILDEHSEQNQVESEIIQFVECLANGDQQRIHLVQISIEGSGKLLAKLRTDGWSEQMRDLLQSEFGHHDPSIWVVDLTVRAREMLPESLFQQETLLGDFLQAIRNLQNDSSDDLSLEEFMGQKHLAGALGPAARLDDPSRRKTILQRASALGIDLLGGDYDHQKDAAEVIG